MYIIFLNINILYDSIYTFSFIIICSFTTYNDDAPTINLSKPIIITKNSNHQTISKFIYSRIDECVNTFYLEDSLIFNKNKEDGPGVIVKYQEINIF